MVVDKKHNRCKCQCCKVGRIVWIQETRFAYFAQVLPVTYSRFKRYNMVLSLLVVWLIENRAVMAMEDQVEREGCVFI
ncbi:hypothetical protein CIK00_07995 [Photobacterium carnosum]|uniref:Uncharacterized protein n=1 Tax=Photobacterium carnosum TaxID=2023717 RepID=A0A2N4UTU3_9GAMM|nr:hypothetical protein CIK00_07995 [Photobacterium carnosum]